MYNLYVHLYYNMVTGTFKQMYVLIIDYKCRILINEALSFLQDFTKL
jgi:hypothetical protein